MGRSKGGPRPPKGARPNGKSKGKPKGESKGDPKAEPRAQKASGKPKAAKGRKAAPAPDVSDGRYLVTGTAHRLNLRGLLKTVAEPVGLGSRRWALEVPHFLVVFSLVIALYAYTTPRYVAFEDDGLFLMNMEFFGVAHPPGYPLHTALGSIFYHLLPWGSPAFRGHLFSGFAGAITCVAVYWIIAMLTRGRVPAYSAALGYGASMTFWSQAIIAEVYTLNTMMFFIVFGMCMCYASHAKRTETRGHRALMCAVALVYGLGLANHWPLLGLGSIGLGLLVLSQLRHILWGIPFAVPCLLLGLTPYLWMVARSWTDTPANFYGPIETLDGFLFYVTRSGYSGVDNQVGVDYTTKLDFLEFLGDQMLWQFTPLGAVLALLGIVAMLRSRQLWVFLSLFLTWFMSSVFLVFALDFKAEFIWLTAFRVYPLVAYGVMAIWLGLGVAWLCDLLPAVAGRWQRPLVGATAGAATVAASLTAHWDLNNRHDYRWAHDFAMFKLNSLEPNTDYYTFDDLDVPVGYLHYVEKVRPDIRVYNDQGLVFGNRIYSPLASQEEKIKTIRKFVDESGERPVYYHPLRVEYFKNEKYGSDFLGFFRRVNKDGPEDRVVLDEGLREWLVKTTEPDSSITDLWTLHQRFTIVATLTSTLALAAISGYVFTGEWKDAIDRAGEVNPLARITTGLTKLQYQKLSEEEIQADWEWMKGMVVRLREFEHLDNKARAHFHLYRALLSLQVPEAKEEVETHLRESVGENPEHDNPALEMLLNMYATSSRRSDFIALLDETYPNQNEIPTNLRRIRDHFLSAEEGGIES